MELDLELELELEAGVGNSSEGAVNGTGYSPHWERPETYLVPAVFLLIFLVGVAGNGALVLVFLRHRSMRTAPNTLILSLALGDLLVLLTCVPFIAVVYLSESWPWGPLVCKLSEAAKDVSVGVSVFTLTALSVERYYAVVRPLGRLPPSRPLATASALLIWLLALALALPALLFSHCETVLIHETQAHISVCTPFLDHSHGRLMVTLQFFLYYLIPILIVGVFYSLMAQHLILSIKCLPGEHRKVQNSQILARRKVAIIVLTFVIIFAVCFFPQRVFMMWFYYSPDSKTDYNMFWHIFRILGFCLAFLNSCVNPVALYFISNSFRKYFNHYLLCRPYRRQDRSSLYATHCSSISRKHNSELLTSLRESRN